MLGLMMSSILTFARDLSRTNVIQRRLQRSRQQTAARTVRSSSEAERVLVFASPPRARVASATTSQNAALARRLNDTPLGERARPLKRTDAGQMSVKSQHSRFRVKLQILREDEERFDEMRKIQKSTARFKKWSLLVTSLSALVSLWLIGAAVFWQLEKDYQEWTYFDAVYFCYVSLLTIGYGDLTPKTNAGRPLFVLWSLLAVPLVTVLISSLSETVVQSFNDWTNALANFTFFQKPGAWGDILRCVFRGTKARNSQIATPNLDELGAVVGNKPNDQHAGHELLAPHKPAAPDGANEHQLAQRLVKAIKGVAHDVKQDSSRLYTYAEWVKFVQLIRFTKPDTEDMGCDEGIVVWDWLGERGPVAASDNEPAWLLDRLIESLERHVRRQGRAVVQD